VKTVLVLNTDKQH